jgi:hypothetical protein
MVSAVDKYKAMRGAEEASGALDVKRRFSEVASEFCRLTGVDEAEFREWYDGALAGTNMPDELRADPSLATSEGRKRAIFEYMEFRIAQSVAARVRATIAEERKKAA